MFVTFVAEYVALEGKKNFEDFSMVTIKIAFNYCPILYLEFFTLRSIQIKIT